MSTKIPETPNPAPKPPTQAAGLPARVAAAAIDLGIVGTLVIVASLCAHLTLVLMPESATRTEPAVLLILGTFLAAAYLVYSWGREGSTLGQKMLDLRVVRTGAPSLKAIGVPRALGRLAGLVLGLIVLDGLVALFRSDRRAFHDVIAGTVVVPFTEPDPSPGLPRPLRTVSKGRKYA